MKIESSDNRRRETRVQCLVPVEGKAGSSFNETRTVNISPNGVGLLSKKKIPLEKTIALEIDTGDQGKPALVVGKVKWVSRVPRSKYYRIGMHFTGPLVSGSQGQLNRYCKKGRT